jgi:radical SAM superfamily enzyme YgiQ (UPF0313 family)
MFSLSVATRLAELIRKHIPELRILWGGAAVEYGIDVFKERNLLDDYIYGDGEYSLTEYLKGNMSYKGINSLEVNQVDNLDAVFLPNYDDINWGEYEDPEQDLPVYITGSRGCVKRCTFCNVYQIWPDFRFRSGKHIAKEIISVKQRYGRRTFRFTDSLINGSMRAFRDLMNVLKEYRKTDSEILWSSQWVIRSKTQSPSTDYENMKKSGCTWLEIGLESFSQDVRFHMGKKFTDEDMWWCLEQLNKYEIPHILLMITGYPTETEEDHQTTLRSVRKIYELGWQKYTNIYFGNTLMLSRSQPLYKLIKDDLEYFDSNVNWKYKDNDLETRIRRFNESNDLVKELSNRNELHCLNERAVDNINKRLENDAVRIT